ncbi:Hypothetical protein, putative [Bodo saltans]|uniref:Transmembrane protein n=1 Tax=Bodo saltans TaxID=75058 RepID=A0A0S4JP46_BODSA|nr:Hypothetical protein, putative [Bodo saltans]|eukprot:CUG91989.1 Hypothetical protein, putative [Bodo saltans]
MDTSRSSTLNGPPAPMRVEIRLWDLEHALLLVCRCPCGPPAMDTSRSSTLNGPPAPMRVEIRLWDLEHALLLDPSSFDILREEVELEHSSYLPSCDIADRSKPTVTVEVRFEHQVGSESRLHTPATSAKQPQVNWQHTPLRSRLVDAPIREVLVFSLHPIALEGLVEFRLYQWACLNEEQLTAIKHQQEYNSRSTNVNDETLCSVSEQDESELVTHQATAKLCIGCLRVPLRSLLQLDHQLRLKLQIDPVLRNEVQHCSDDVYDAIAGVAYGGVASLSCHVSAFFAECVLPVPPAAPTAQRSPLRRHSVADNGLLLTGRATSQESVASSSSQYSLIGTDTMELRLLLVPMRIVNDIMRIILDVMLWRRPLATGATLLVVMLASLFELYHILGVVLLMAGTIRCTRAARLATSKAMSLGSAEVDNVVLLYPPNCVLLNGIIRGDLWLQAGHSDEAFLEVVHLSRRIGQRAASLSVLLWVVAAVYMWIPIDVFVPMVTSLALLVYPLTHTALFGVSIRKRTQNGGDIALGPWEVLLPKPFTRTPLPVTRIVKAYVPIQQVLTRASTMSPPGSSFRKDVTEGTLPPQRSSSTPAEGKVSSGLSQQPSPSATRPGVVALDRQTTQEDMTGGGTTQTFVSSDVEVSPDSPEFHKHGTSEQKAQGAGKEPHTPAPRVPKLKLSSHNLPPAPPLSARAQRLESDVASGSRVSSERIETPRQRATPRMHSTQHAIFPDPVISSGVTDSIVPLPRRQSGNIAAPNLGAQTMLPSSAHRRTQSQLITTAPSFSYAVVTVECREDHLSDATGHNLGVRNLYNTNSAASQVKERLRQFYQKLENAEQRLLMETRHQQPSFVMESTGSVNSAAGLTASGSRVSSERIETPRQRATPSTQHAIFPDPVTSSGVTDSIVPLLRRQSGNIAAPNLVAQTMLPSSAHRRTQSQLINTAPSFSYAVVTVECREDHLSDATGHNLGVRNLYNTNSAASQVKERLRQFYQKLENAEQRLLMETRHQQPSFVMESTGSVNSAAGLTSTGKNSSQFAIHDNVVQDATLLLLYLRRMWKTAIVHVSTGSMSAAESAGAAVDRLERIANPSTLMEHISSDQVTSTLLTGFAQLPVARLATVRGLDENCRAWALMCMCFLSGKRASLFAPHGMSKISFLVPLQPQALTFDVSTNCTASCPPPLAPALQDLWRGWKENNKDSHGLVTLDMILTIISAHRDFWKHPNLHTLSPSIATPMLPPMPPATSATNGPLGVPISSSASRRMSHQRPITNASPLRIGAHVSELVSWPGGPTMTSAGSWVLVHNDMKSPVDAATNSGNAGSGRVGSPPLSLGLAPPAAQTSSSHHDTPFLDYFAGGVVSASFESEASGAYSAKNRRSVYESLGLKSQRKERDSPEVLPRMSSKFSEDLPSTGAGPTTPLPVSSSPVPQSPQKDFSDAFPSFSETRQYTSI